MRGFLFDIDGTLLNTEGAGCVPFEKAIHDETGFSADLSKVDWVGRTDTAIMTEVLSSFGLNGEKIREILPRLFGRFIVYFREVAEKEPSRFRALSGVPALLESLEGMPFGLLTGNVKEAAMIKLETAGIGRFFRDCPGAFGDEHADRNALSLVARDRMMSRHPDLDDIVVLGDSVRDIDCARAAGLKVLAVASGKTTLLQLSEKKPDYLMEHFADTASVVRLLLEEA